MKDRRGFFAPFAFAALAGCGTSPEAPAPRDGGTSGDVAPREAAPDRPQARETWARVDSQGRYTVSFAHPAWSFAGRLPAGATGITERTGDDAIGSYHEVTFSSRSPAQTLGVRAYDAVSAAVFTVTYPEGAPNVDLAFPRFDVHPELTHHLTYSDDAPFAPASFDEWAPDSPFVVFDDRANTFILSAASDFMNAATLLAPGGTIASAIDPSVPSLPARFSHQTILVARPGITKAYATWGDALLALSGKARTATDATPELERFGYWTDSGAYYYFRFEPSLGYEGTLLAVRDYFERIGAPLAYLQLDAWWYPKGPKASWRDNIGLYLYEADAQLFPKGLADFQRSLGLPLVTHANWVDPASPYRSEYAMSNNVSIEPAYWKKVADYIGDAGVTVYEQDFLNKNALPVTTNLTDQNAFLDEMASAFDAKGIGMQYCMPLPRHYLQGTRYKNLLTTRVSGDRFNPARYEDFLYTSLLTGSLGSLPWSDVFFSTETSNLLMATLSAGIVGVGDEIGTASATNLAQAMRPDGVIVKPDVPIVPLDQSFIQEAKGVDAPLVAATYSDYGGVRVSYVYAFNRGWNSVSSFSPAMLGYRGRVYVLDYFNETGQAMDAGETHTEEMVGGSAYYVVAPVGPSGIALLGDAGKFVALGKKRFGDVKDDGVLTASVVFAPDEGPVVLRGYAASKPTVTATRGKTSAVMYDPATGVFRVSVSPAGGSAVVRLQ
jgi:hypothetical protein